MGRKDKRPADWLEDERPLGSRMRLARQKQGVSLATMASSLGFTSSYLSMIENNKYWPPRSVVESYEGKLGNSDLLSLWVNRVGLSVVSANISLSRESRESASEVANEPSKEEIKAHLDFERRFRSVYQRVVLEVVHDTFVGVLPALSSVKMDDRLLERKLFKRGGLGFEDFRDEIRALEFGLSRIQKAVSENRLYSQDGLRRGLDAVEEIRSRYYRVTPKSATFIGELISFEENIKFKASIRERIVSQTLFQYRHMFSPHSDFVDDDERCLFVLEQVISKVHSLYEFTNGVVDMLRSRAVKDGVVSRDVSRLVALAKLLLARKGTIMDSQRIMEDALWLYLNQNFGYQVDA